MARLAESRDTPHRSRRPQREGPLTPRATCWLHALCLLLPAAAAQAEVAHLEILNRQPFADGRAYGQSGAYEIVEGRLHYSIDPADPANRRIVDLALAPRDGEGRVTFSGDFLLLTPLDPGRGNRRLLYDVTNRGNLVALHLFNDAPFGNSPETPADAGNGFLLDRGYSLLWSAWNWDVVPGDGRLQIDLPVATNGGETVTGTVAAEIAPLDNRRYMPVVWGNARGYPPAVWDDPAARLTVRTAPDAQRQEIPRDLWRFAHITLPGAADGMVALELDERFHAGALYELVYEAKDPRVVGLGLAAIRDALSFFRYETADRAGTPNPLAPDDGALPARALIFGASQSGRAIQHMLWEALHLDEKGQPVFDAAFVHVAGAGKGAFNHRFAQTTRHPSHWEDRLYPADVFPFTNQPQEDPVTGQKAGLLDRAEAAGPVPPIFHTTTSTEYWTRAASLLHSDVTGSRDLPPDERTRLYFLAGTKHTASGSARRAGYAHCGNPADYRPALRALLIALDAWVGDGTEPPPSRIPRIADGSLGSVAAYRAAFPALADIPLPRGNLRPPRLDLGPRFADEGIADRQPAAPGEPFVTLVPQPDADGIDRGGIRLPEIAVPLGSALGWNLLPTGGGRWERLGRWRGSFLPFAATAAERTASGDPRPALEERYASRTAFLAATRAAALDLVDRRLLLRRDMPGLLGRAGRAYDAVTGRDEADGCRYLDTR